MPEHYQFHPNRPQVRAVAAAVAVVFNVPVPVITGMGRSREKVVARRALCYLAAERIGYSMSHIGRCIQRDHTTVLHHVVRARIQVPLNAELRAMIDAAEALAWTQTHIGRSQHVGSAHKTATAADSAVGEPYVIPAADGVWSAGDLARMNRAFAVAFGSVSSFQSYQS